MTSTFTGSGIHDFRGHLGLDRLGVRRRSISRSSNSDASPLEEKRQRYIISGNLEAADNGIHQLIEVSSGQFRHAWAMRQKYDDKPDIPFVDFTSMIVMQDHGITDVFTGDDHFRQVGLGFRLVP